LGFQYGYIAQTSVLHDEVISPVIFPNYIILFPVYFEIALYFGSGIVVSTLYTAFHIAYQSEQSFDDTVIYHSDNVAGNKEYRDIRHFGVECIPSHQQYKKSAYHHSHKIV
jgi:hypothetical protein